MNTKKKDKVRTYTIAIKQYKEIYKEFKATSKKEAEDMAWDYACNLDWGNIDHDYEFKVEK